MGIILGVLGVLFILLRIFGVDIPLHQDEYKWPIIVNPALTEEGGIPHPPVGEFIYRQAGFLLGYDNFRFVPFFFGFLNLFLLFYLVRNIFNTRTALWSVGLFTVSFYSVLASLMVDTDGAVMPFFALLSFILYFKWRNNPKIFFWAPLLISLVLGFLIKSSFIIAIATLVLDFAVENDVFKDRKRVLKYTGLILIGLLGLVALLFAVKFVFPYFRLEWTINYWRKFVNFHDRGWLQILIQFSKSIIYTSPLLIAPIFFANKEVFRRGRIFFIFILLGLIFYIGIFDFSQGALDRYLQLMIIPLCVIAGAVFAKYISFDKKGEVIWPIIISGLILSLQFFPHFVPSLYPKTEWISRAISLKWNFLFPFLGGSGPTPFYVSFLFIAMVWVVSCVVVIVAIMKKETRRGAILGIFILGLAYNGVFVEEYVFGRINGNSSVLIKDAAAFIIKNPDIKKVTVYNDNGGYEIQQTGKYRKRLYVDPKFDIAEKIKTLNLYKEHYLVIDIPHLDPSTVYAQYFATCEVVYKKESGKISSIVYDCKNAPDIKL